MRVQIKCLIVVVVSMARCTCADDPAELKRLTETLKRSAAPNWSAAINRLFAEDIAITVELTDDGADATILWRNYTAHSTRALTQKSPRYEHVWAANPKYHFDVTKNLNGNGFALRAISSGKGDAANTAPQLGMLVPEWTFFNTPLIAILDESLFRLDSVVEDTDDQIRIDVHTIRDFTINRPPYFYFRNDYREGTEFTLWVDRSRSWRLTKATSVGPGQGMEWEQTVAVENSGKVIGHIVGKLRGEVEREYSYASMESPLPPYKKSEFYLPYYGLSESTASHLMSSRRYILVFCGLFFGAIFFRILAYVLKRQRIKNSEAAL